jgi:hypothetical protein
VATHTAWMRRRGRKEGLTELIKGGAQSDSAERIAERSLGPWIAADAAVAANSAEVVESPVVRAELGDDRVGPM